MMVVFRPDEVDHVNAHGTSTPENDKMEALSLNEVFGDRILEVPVASNKGQLGHTLLAAGAVEAVISLMTIKNNIIPANMNYETPDPAINLDIVANEPREEKCEYNPVQQLWFCLPVFSKCPVPGLVPNAILRATRAKWR